MIFLTFLNRFFDILGYGKYSNIFVLLKRTNLEYIKKFWDIFPIVWFYKKDLDTLTRISTPISTTGLVNQFHKVFFAVEIETKWKNQDDGGSWFYLPPSMSILPTRFVPSAE